MFTVIERFGAWFRHMEQRTPVAVLFAVGALVEAVALGAVFIGLVLMGEVVQ